MTTDDCVAELLFQWESATIKPSVESLCRDRPDLIPRIQREIAIIQKFNQDFEEDPPEVPVGPPAPPVIPGHTVGAYIGAGGMGHVWEATDLALNRTVALKVLKLFGSGEQLAIATQRFQREMRLAARLRHPGIATIFAGDLVPVTPGEHADPARSYYYTMELIRGNKRTRGDMLDDYVRNQSLSPRGVVELFLKVCEAVAYAHGEGIVHRDLKPANIMVDAEGQPKILDLGIARDIRENASSYTAKYGGTPDYMGPAQRHGEEASPEMDVHALGCILFDLLNIACPHPNGVQERVPSFQRVITEEMVHTQMAPVPPALVSIICRTQKTTTEPPFQNAAMLVGAIREYLDEKHASPQIGTSHLPRRWLGVSLAVAALVIMAVIAYWMMHPPRMASAPALPSAAAAEPPILPMSPSDPRPRLYIQVKPYLGNDHESVYQAPPPPITLTTKSSSITPSANLPVKLQATVDGDGHASLTAPGLRWMTFGNTAPLGPVPPDDKFKPGDAASSVLTDPTYFLIRFTDSDGKVGYVVLRVRYGN